MKNMTYNERRDEILRFFGKTEDKTILLDFFKFMMKKAPQNLIYEWTCRYDLPIIMPKKQG